MKHATIRISLITALTTLSIALPGIGSGGPDAAVAATVPACNGSTFWGAWVGQNGATGTLIDNVAFINDGNAACRLSGFPTIQGYKNGHEHPLNAGHINGAAFDIHPTIVAPRMSAVMVITTADDCNALNTGGQTEIKEVIARESYAGITVKFPHSNTPVPVYGMVLDVACGLNVTPIGWR